MSKNTISIRKVTASDKDALFKVERLSTPNLQYLPFVFDQFLADQQGIFLAAEIDGQLCACGKMSVLPDGSGWLETLRVIPEKQGLGIGKQFYEKFLETAASEGVNVLRMYTGVKNLVSKGLAERFGFAIAGEYTGGWLDCSGEFPGGTLGFEPVTDIDQAENYLLPLIFTCGGFVIMNRTFYKLTSAFCAHLVKNCFLFRNKDNNSIIALGARFMPRAALHIALLDGDLQACLNFARQEAHRKGIPQLQCLYSPDATDQLALMKNSGFNIYPSNFIVMERNLG